MQGVGQKCRLPFLVDAVTDELKDPSQNEECDVDLEWERRSCQVKRA